VGAAAGRPRGPWPHAAASNAKVAIAASARAAYNGDRDMKRQVLHETLHRHAALGEHDAVLEVGEDQEVSLYIGIGVGSEPLIIDRIKLLALESEVLVAETRRREKYLIAYEDVRAVRVSLGDRSAGY
jgi:hypothetical protein